MRHLRDELSTIGRRVLTPVAVLFVTYLVGIAGYKLIGGGDASWMDALYMTTITLTTTGYREVIDITTHPGAMGFTIVLLLFGATAVVVTGSMITAYVVEGDLTAGFRRRRMQRLIEAMRAQKSVPLIQPRISRDGRRLLPGEAGYEEAAGMGGRGKWQ